MTNTRANPANVSIAHLLVTVFEIVATEPTNNWLYVKRPSKLIEIEIKKGTNLPARLEIAFLPCVF